MESKKDTKFYFISYDTNVKEIPLNDAVHGSRIEKDQQFDNWFFAQMNASIRCAFLSHGIEVPKCVYIDRCYRNSNKMLITIVRNNVNGEKGALKWYKNWFFVLDDLNRAAMANSDFDDDFTFKFRII